MTVASEVSRSGPYNGNGVTTVFDYDFRIVNEAHLQVIKADAEGEETILTLATDYTVSGVGSDSGDVTISVAPITGETITILRAVPFVQGTDLENQGPYLAQTVEDALDLAAMRDQQLQEQIDRSVKIPISADSSELDGLIADILRLEDSADNIDTVAGIADEVEELAPYAQTIAENVSDITNFADVYQGPKAADPVLRNDGSALNAGDLYFNTALNELRVYDGASWLSVTDQALNLASKVFTGDGVTVAFTLNSSPAAAQNVLVFVGGALQVPVVDYSVSATTLTLDVAPANGVEIVTLVISSSVNLTAPSDGTVTFPSLTPGVIHDAPVKAVLADADEFLLSDSAAGWALKKPTVANVVSSIFNATRKIVNGWFEGDTFRIYKAATAFYSWFDVSALAAARKLTVQDRDVTIGIVRGATVTPSGTIVDYTGIPSDIYRLNIHLRDLTINAAGVFLVRVGPAGGVLGAINTYFGAAAYNNNTSLLVIDLSTLTYIAIDAGAGHTGPISGTLVFNNVPGTNTWIYQGTFSVGIAVKQVTVSGSVVLAGALARFTVGTVANTSTFNNANARVWATWEY